MHKAYNLDITISGDHTTTVDQFITTVSEVLEDLNNTWEKVKSGIPTDQREAAEKRVRAVIGGIAAPDFTIEERLKFPQINKHSDSAAAKKAVSEKA